MYKLIKKFTDLFDYYDEDCMVIMSLLKTHVPSNYKQEIVDSYNSSLKRKNKIEERNKKWHKDRERKIS